VHTIEELKRMADSDSYAQTTSWRRENFLEATRYLEGTHVPLGAEFLIRCYFASKYGEPKK
jgi:hypothetical protein